MTIRTKLTIALTLLLLFVASIAGSKNIVSTPVPITGYSPNAVVTDSSAMPTLNDFTQNLQNGDSTTLVGVYVTGQMALPVVQQPTSNPAYVSTTPEVVTQFGSAAKYNSQGLLAHNYLAGKHFYSLQKGQEVILVFGDGSIRRYKIDEILSYQALSPEDVYSHFVPLQGQRNQMTSTDLFYQTYGKGDNLVLQTCIQVGSEPSWGRLFVIAHPDTAVMLAAPVNDN